MIYKNRYVASAKLTAFSKRGVCHQAAQSPTLTRMHKRYWQHFANQTHSADNLQGHPIFVGE